MQMVVYGGATGGKQSEILLFLNLNRWKFGKWWFVLAWYEKWRGDGL